MRSLLYEAATVPKAIEKAWANSGRPNEFTIRVYETERKSFLGFTKKYAVVSIIFDPKKQTRPDKKFKKTREPSRPTRMVSSEKNVNYKDNKKAAMDYESSEDTSRDTGDSFNTWSTELTNHVALSLKDLSRIMGVTIKFSVRVERHLLRIEFDKPVMDAPSEERLLFSSFAYLLMQFLKREYKKGFRNCRIAISSLRK